MASDFEINLLESADDMVVATHKELGGLADGSCTQDNDVDILDLASALILNSVNLFRESPDFEKEQITRLRDYLGNPITTYLIECYEKCLGCGRYVWKKSNIMGFCPPCVIALPDFILEVSFGRSPSKKYRTALKRARAIPTYIKDGERHVILFDNLGEYSTSREAVAQLLLVVFRWKSLKVLLNGAKASSDNVSSIRYEINRMRDREKAIDITFVGNTPVYTYKPHPAEGETNAVDYYNHEQFIDAEVIEVYYDD